MDRSTGAILGGHMFKVEVVADNSGKYAGNALRFKHVKEAEEYAINLMSRWMLVRTWRVVDEEGKVYRQG